MGNQLSARAIGPIQSKAEALTEALKPETVAEVSAGSRLWDKGEGVWEAVSKKTFFGPSGLSMFGLKIRGDPGPSPGSANGSAKFLGSCKRLCQVQTWSSHSVWAETYHISGTKKKTKHSTIKRKGQQTEKDAETRFITNASPIVRLGAVLKHVQKWLAMLAEGLK